MPLAPAVKGWPKKNDAGEFYDVAGVIFDQSIHSHWTTGDRAGTPRVNRKGEFFARGGKKTRKQQLVDEKLAQETMTDQLYKAAKQWRSKNGKIDGVRKIADNMIAMATNEDDKYGVKEQQWAMAEVFDRIEGKATQRSEEKKDITVQVIQDFGKVLPDEMKPVIEGEVLDQDDPNMKQLMSRLE